MNTIVESLGWTLIHFLWQGTLIAVLLWGALQILRTAPAQWRYLAAGLAMLLMLASAVFTGSDQWQRSVPPISSVSQEILFPPTSEIASPNAPAPPSDLQPSTSQEGSSRASTMDDSVEERQALGPLVRLQQRLHTWLPGIVALWVIGMAVLSLSLLRRWLALRRIRSGARAVDDPASIDTLSRLMNKMHVRQSVTLLVTSESVVPMVVAWLRPVIIVPTSFLTRLPGWQVEAILAHELAHIRRQDYLVNLLQNIVEIVFFYHPAVWWVSAQLRKEREHCCDDIAAAACGGALEYAKALTALEGMRGCAPAGTMSVSGSSLLARVQRLLGVKSEESRAALSWPIGIAIALLGACLVISSHFVHGAPQDIDLSEVPHVNDVTTIAELYEPDPDHPGEFQKKPDVFFMRLGEVNVGPWLYYAANSKRFYLSVREDPDVVKDTIFGPIPGDPVDKLDLNQWLRDQRDSGDPGYVFRVMRDMVQCNDESLNRAAFAYMQELGPPKERDAYDDLIDVTQRVLKERPVSAIAAEAATALAHVKGLADIAKEAWESSRKPLPDSQYASGTPIAEEDASIMWAEPNDVGLRLGLSGIGSGNEWSIGSVVSFRIFVRNDGSDPVKFSWTSRKDDGFRAMLRRKDGTSISADIVQWDSLLIPNRTRLSPAEMQLIKMVDLHIIRPNDDGSAPDRQASEDRFIVNPGAYEFEAEVPFSSFQLVPPAGEWIGRLTTQPIAITVSDEGGNDADPPASAEPRHEQTAAILTLWRDEYGDAAQIPGEAMQRLAGKVSDFIEQYPGESADQMKALLSELEEARTWTGEEILQMLDTVCDISTAPVGWLELDERLRSFNRVKSGEKLPDEKLAALPFGPSSSNGLRVARLFDPMRGTYHIGDELSGRIFFHNNGQEAIEFATDQWHQEDSWHCKDATGKEITVKSSWHTGITPYQRYRLEPGQVCEVSAQGTGIGEEGFEEARSTGRVSSQIPAKVGDRITCWWDVRLDPSWGEENAQSIPKTLRTGEVTFNVVARDSDGNPNR